MIRESPLSLRERAGVRAGDCPNFRVRLVIEKILRGHQSVAMVGGLWNPSTPRAPPACWRLSLSPAADDFSDSPTESSDERSERTYVDIDTLEATF